MISPASIIAAKTIEQPTAKKSFLAGITLALSQIVIIKQSCRILLVAVHAATVKSNSANQIVRLWSDGLSKLTVSICTPAEQITRCAVVRHEAACDSKQGPALGRGRPL
jgi:hypothetical protein